MKFKIYLFLFIFFVSFVSYSTYLCPHIIKSMGFKFPVKSTESELQKSELQYKQDQNAKNFRKEIFRLNKTTFMPLATNLESITQELSIDELAKMVESTSINHSVVEVPNVTEFLFNIELKTEFKRNELINNFSSWLRSPTLEPFTAFRRVQVSSEDGWVIKNIERNFELPDQISLWKQKKIENLEPVNELEIDVIEDTLLHSLKIREKMENIRKRPGYIPEIESLKDSLHIYSTKFQPTSIGSWNDVQRLEVISTEYGSKFSKDLLLTTKVLIKIIEEKMLELSANIYNANPSIVSHSARGLLPKNNKNNSSYTQYSMEEAPAWSLIEGVLSFTQAIASLMAEKIDEKSASVFLEKLLIESDLISVFARSTPMGLLGPLSLMGKYKNGVVNIDDKVKIGSDLMSYFQSEREKYKETVVNPNDVFSFSTGFGCPLGFTSEDSNFPDESGLKLAARAYWKVFKAVSNYTK